MMNDLRKFDKFHAKRETKEVSNSNVWCYTRISTKDQSKHSIDVQGREIKEYAKKKGYIIVKEFGGTYESASSDMKRKEFKKLLSEIRKAKQKPFAILLYSINRFSRTGASAIAIALEIISDHNVHIIEVSTGMTTFNDIDELNLYKALIDARKENLDRQAFTRPGLKAHLEKGYWLGNTPRGYTHYGPRVTDTSKVRGEQKIVLNDTGKLLRKAWYWKLEGMSDAEIIRKLRGLGLTVLKSFISAMWRKPFYCGVNSNKLLDKPVEGKWESMISQDDFWKVQALLKGNHQGYKIVKENNNRPLTGFALCKCGRKLHSYKATKRDVHYYECRDCRGSCINANTTKRSKGIGLHDIFIKTLELYSIPDKALNPIMYQLENLIKGKYKEEIDEQKKIEAQSKIIMQKIEKIEEKHILDKIDNAIFEKFNLKYQKELSELERNTVARTKNMSNIKNKLRKNLILAQNLPEYWKKGNYTVKRMLQNLLFPHGILVDTKKRTCRTKSVNSFFDVMSTLAGNLAKKEKELDGKNTEKSFVVAGTGLEPVTFGL